MDAAVEGVLREFSIRSEAEIKRMKTLDGPEHQRVRDEFLLAIGPASGQLLNLLIKEAGARAILEVGTSYGYSTLWLAEAARANGGKLVTLELIPQKSEAARAAMTKAGLADSVDFRVGDALVILATLEGPFDFVLLDLWKDLYIECFNAFYPKLNPGAFIAADNMIFPPATQKEAREYREYVRGVKDIRSILLPVGSGLELSRYTRGLEMV